MEQIIFSIGLGCIGLWLGSLIERIISFTALRREMTGLLDQIDGNKD
ncbi:hypothetical protein [Mucisphaera calidilacus]|uniref:Uncharacterized protein n=1 Tax=Mucisphaera calidilacus TaxID=2527982 RepID=A0A518BVN2_9BACT|nr:hypothetical protein [Mucisphaera calidilacus]QDU71036.1 hypothetical protein Pan265_08810 [Mucisphaera calidilacus]